MEDQVLDQVVEKVVSKPQKRSIFGRKASRRISNAIIYVVLILMSIIWLVPFVCIVIQSFRVEDTNIVPYILPKQWGFDNYNKLFNETKFWDWFGRTFIIALVCSIVQTLFILSVSYVLSRFRFKGRKTLMNIILVLGMFPGFLTMIVLYTVLKDLGMIGSGSIPGLILVYCASSGMGYYISKGFFDTIPRSLDEAARVDGANRFQVFYKIIMPLAKPIVIYTILTAFMGPWGDFIFAATIAHHDPSGFNVAVGLNWLIETDTQISQYYTVFCAGGVIIAIPITILFMALQRYYVEGVVGGAVKG